MSTLPSMATAICILVSAAIIAVFIRGANASAFGQRYPFEAELFRRKRYHGAMMGVITACDDAQDNLDVDWPKFSYHKYTCSGRPWPSVPVEPLYYNIADKDKSFDPEKDVVWHKCMNETLTYSDSPPLRGDHRPNWAVYGEYMYLPPQRWLHNLEHGSVIMLYHPCADPTQVQELRSIVESCLYRHIVTPYSKLSKFRPLALVSWGAKLEMNEVDPELVQEFIKKHARHAPEDLSKQGKYVKALLSPSKIVSNIDDEVICPDDDDVSKFDDYGKMVYQLKPYAEF